MLTIQPHKVLFVLFAFFSINAFSQSDCADALVVCGNNDYTNLNATGIGIQELNINNACSSVENNSIWFKLVINEGGTLGFNLIPQSNNIVVDFDFWVFGPDVSCGNLGTAIRCSTTNPQASLQGDNHTGMNETETDTSEGPGPLGNSYIQWLNVQSGETYYLIVDRPIGTANFSLEWTGTATFHEAPVFLNPDSISIDLAQCDDDGVDDTSTGFDLTVFEAMHIGSQNPVIVTYHLSENDMITGENPIASPQAFANTTNPQTIYMRMTNQVTGCYANETFTIAIDDVLPTGEPEDLTACDYADDGFQMFDLNLNSSLVANNTPDTKVTYYSTQQDADNGSNALHRFFTNSTAYATQTIWARLEYITGCFGHGLTSFTLSIIPPLDFSYSVDVVDFNDRDNSITINMAAGEEAFEFSLNGITYQDENFFGDLDPGLYTVYVRGKDGCKEISFEVVILNYPKFFTPNGDNVNEIWNVSYIRNFPESRITIFDRYGKLIKSYRGSQSGWEGMLNGKNLPSTDYWFVLELETGREIKGHFSLVR